MAHEKYILTKEVSELLESDDEFPGKIIISSCGTSTASELKRMLCKELDVDAPYDSSQMQWACSIINFYEDTPYTPAYQNDSRFEPIQFAWLDKQLKESHSAEFSKLETQIINQENPVLSKEKNTTLISKGVMTKRDIYFIKCVEEFSKDMDTLLWFIDFLKSKSAQPKKNGCLIWNIFPDHYIETIEPLPQFNTQFYYKLITKAW